MRKRETEERQRGKKERNGERPKGEMNGTYKVRAGWCEKGKGENHLVVKIGYHMIACVKPQHKNKSSIDSKIFTCCVDNRKHSICWRCMGMCKISHRMRANNNNNQWIVDGMEKGTGKTIRNLHKYTREAHSIPIFYTVMVLAGIECASHFHQYQCGKAE